MSGVPLANAAIVARDAAIQLCWTQWRSIGSTGSSGGASRAEAIIDPEALILLSLHCQSEERRLTDMVAWWAEVGSGLTSLQRMRQVAKRFPGHTGRDGLELFASLATRSGDRRWRRQASDPVPDWVRAGKGPEEPTLVESSALWPRLRAGFGVGAKADTLVFLLGLQGAWASARVISYATGYSTVAIRRAAGEMALAHLIRETEGRPAEYVAPSRQWAELLELKSFGKTEQQSPQLPPWRFWSEISAFLVGVVELHRRSQSDPPVGPHVIASAAKDLIEQHHQAFTLNNIPIPPPNAFRGVKMLDGLHETVRVVSEWTGKAV